MKSTVLFSLCLFVLTVCGCSGVTTPVCVQNNDNSYLEQGRIQFERGSTRHVVKVERANPERLPSGQLKLFLTLRNTKKKDVWVEIRTTFIDKNCRVLEQTNWEEILLDARTVSEYTCTSMGKQACDYQVIIRNPRKVDVD